MQGTFPESLKKIDLKMKEEIDFKWFFKFPKKICGPYVCIGNFLQKKKNISKSNWNFWIL